MEKILCNSEVDFNLVNKIKREEFKVIKDLKNDNDCQSCTLRKNPIMHP